VSFQRDAQHISVRSGRRERQRVGLDAGVVRVVVCEWIGLIAIEGAASRTGDGVVNLAIRAFDGTAERSGTFTIAQQSFTVTQSGCLVRLGATELAFAGGGGSEDLRIDTIDGCRWIVENAPAWASFDPDSGAGPGVTRVRATRNTTTSTRDNAVRIGAQTLTLRQAQLREAEPPTSPPLPQPRACVYSVSPVEAFVPTPGGSGVVNVATAAGCAWTASIAAAHARIRRGAAGSGPEQIEYEVDPNSETYVVGFRRAAIEVRWNTPTAGQNVCLSQFGDCRTVVSPSITFTADGGEFRQNVLVESPFNCPWRVEGSAPWLTIFPGMAIFITVFGINLLGDGLRDIFDPKLRRQR
jgi:hypothetical protein